jgi:hypothetical protein
LKKDGPVLIYRKIQFMRLKEFPAYMVFLIGNTVVYSLKAAEKVLQSFGIELV